MAFIYDDNGDKYNLPDNDPTNYELRVLKLFVKHQLKDKIAFLPSTVLSAPAERAALTRLTNKGWLDRERPLATIVRINPAGWWMHRHFEPDDV